MAMQLEAPDGYGLLAELGLDEPGRRRLQKLFASRPVRWSKLANIGHQSPLGKRFARSWVDYRTPHGYLSMRDFIGARLLLDTAARYGFPNCGPAIQPFLETRSPVRYIRRTLLSQLLTAEAVAPWPAMRAPYAQMLVMAPEGACTAAVSGQKPDSLAALLLHFRDGAGGLELSWDAFGWHGAYWADSWGVKPLLEFPISRIAWAVAALLQSDEPAGSTSAVSAVRVTRQGLATSRTPEPPWLEPRRPAGFRERFVENPDGTPRAPHWRRAHLHQFWTGKRNGDRKLVSHWLPAVWVDSTAGAED
jgi:hypothetical protein